MDKRVVLCGANSYEQKYYFNKDFSLIAAQLDKIAEDYFGKNI